MPAAKTVTNTTSATPIISAAAVTAVRPGLAHRVLARQAAGDAAQALHRPADERRQRPHQPRADSDTANSISAAPPPIRPPRCRPTRCRRTGRSAAGPAPAAASEHGDDRAAPRPRLRASGSSASQQRRHRRHAGGAQRRARAPATSGHAPCRRPAPRSTVRGSNTLPVLGRSMPIALNSARSPMARADAAEQAEQRCPPPRSAQRLAAPPSARIWRARGAQRAQQPELADALGHGDRERVEDQERGHHGDHAGEAPAARSRRTLRKSWLISSRLAAGVLAARSRPAPCAAARLRTRRLSCCGADAVGAGRDRDLVELAPAAGHALGLGQRQRGRRRPAERRRRRAR